jgi:hypothetical protein
MFKIFSIYFIAFISQINNSISHREKRFIIFPRGNPTRHQVRDDENWFLYLSEYCRWTLWVESCEWVTWPEAVIQLDILWERHGNWNLAYIRENRINNKFYWFLSLDFTMKCYNLQRASKKIIIEYFGGVRKFCHRF